jgi:hypothetical protein
VKKRGFILQGDEHLLIQWRAITPLQPTARLGVRFAVQQGEAGRCGHANC